MWDHLQNNGKIKKLQLQKNITILWICWARDMLWGYEYLSQGWWTFGFFLHGGIFQTSKCILLFIVEFRFKVPQLGRWKFPKRCTNPSYHLIHLKLQYTQPSFEIHYGSPVFIFVILVSYTNHTSFFWHALILSHALNHTLAWWSFLPVQSTSKTYFQTFHPISIFVHSEPKSHYNLDS